MTTALELMPFQHDGANLLSTSKRAMLVWDAGVGKTPTAVRGAMKTAAHRILVFCPPIAVSVWRDHFKAWSNYQDIRVLDASNVAKPYAFMAGDGVRIVSYSRVSISPSIIEAAMRDIWDVAILDEVHYLKNPEAVRTKAVYGGKIDLNGTPLGSARHVWCLSGTPIMNHAQEFWTHLHALRPDLIVLPQLGVMDVDTFTERFCVTRTTAHGPPRIMGSKNTHELGERVKPFADRKRMRDVLKDMPPLRIVEHPLPADTVIERALRDELVKAASDLNLDAVDDDELLAEFQSSQVAFSTVRRLIGRAKVEGVANMVNDFLDDAEEEKLILFAHHREVIRDLADRLKRHAPLVIKGDTNQKVRESAIHAFQNDPKFRLIILAIDTAGEVITLHAAHNVFLMEPSPVPAKNHQAIARAYRNGQKYAVLARFILLPGTLDARLMAIVARKTRDIARIVDGEHDVSHETA
jgi:SWI/SNF-related matrix-associated actin-dependent regulator of chromatin subfamily A-like protein 1